MMEERKCCGTFEGTPHRNTCRPNMIKEITRLTAQLAERDAEIERLKLIEVVYRAIINNTHIAEAIRKELENER